MAGLFPLSRQQQTDSDGNLLAGARLFLFDGGTLTPRVGYKDLALTSEHPNPILADSSGRLPLIYLADGYYRQRLTSSTGELIFDDDGIPVLSTSAGGAGTSVDPDSVFKTGNIKIDFGDGVIDGYVRANGKTIGNAASGGTERANADTEALFTKLWAYDNSPLSSGSKGASAAADYAANKAIVLPNCQGNLLAGMPDMGGTADSAFAALLSGTTADPGATGGADTVTLVQGNVPSYTLTGGSGSVSGTTEAANTTHTHAVTGTTGAASNDHTHTTLVPTTAKNVGTDGPVVSVMDFASASVTSSGQSQSHTHAVNFTSGINSNNHTHIYTGTASSISISSGGSGTAVNKLPSLMTFMIYIRL